MSFKEIASLASVLTAFAFVVSGAYSLGFFFRVDIDLVTTLQTTDYIALGIRGLPIAAVSLAVGAVVGVYRSEKKHRLKEYGAMGQDANETKVGRIPISKLGEWAADKKILRKQLNYGILASIILYFFTPQFLQFLLVPGAFALIFMIYLNFDHDDDFYIFSSNLLISVMALLFVISAAIIGYSTAVFRLHNEKTEYQITLRSDAVFMADIIVSTEKYLLVQSRDPSQLRLVQWVDIQELSKPTRSTADSLSEIQAWKNRYLQYFD